MPRVNTPMYQCSRCENYMPAEDRAAKRVRIISDTVNVEYTQDLCPPCVQEDIAGQQTKGVRRRSARVKQSPAAASNLSEAGSHLKAS